jgi:hypothetical protein
MKLEGLNTTEWWMLRERIKNVDIQTLGHTMDNLTYVLLIADRTGQQFELEIDIPDDSMRGNSILNPKLVRKL